MNENELQDVGEQIAQKRRKGAGNPALIDDKSLDLEPGDNRKFMAVGLRLYSMPKVDLKDPDAVNDRIKEYFQVYAEADLKPTVTGLGMALGVDRRRLWEIATGNYRDKTQANLPAVTQDSIKKAYDFLANLWENYMQNGKVNPVSGIFLGKNHFGYQDKQDIVITPNRPEEDYNASDIANRYTLPEATDSDE